MAKAALPLPGKFLLDDIIHIPSKIKNGGNSHPSIPMAPSIHILRYLTTTASSPNISAAAIIMPAAISISPAASVRVVPFFFVFLFVIPSLPRYISKLHYIIHPRQLFHKCRSHCAKTNLPKLAHEAMRGLALYDIFALTAAICSATLSLAGPPTILR